MKDFEDVNVITLNFKEGAEKLFQDDWLVDGLFKKGTFNIITGSYEEETNVAYKLATCLNNGIDFFGHNVKESSCLYVDCMHSNSEIFYKGKKTVDDLGISDPINIRVMPLWRKNIPFKQMLKGVKQALINTPEIDVIFYDNFHAMFEGDINNCSEVMQAMVDLEMTTPNATVFIVCDAVQSCNDPIYCIRGSGVFGSHADEIMCAKKGKKIQVVGRHTPLVELS